MVSTGDLKIFLIPAIELGRGGSKQVTPLFFFFFYVDFAFLRQTLQLTYVACEPKIAPHVSLIIKIAKTLGRGVFGSLKVRRGEKNVKRGVSRMIFILLS